MESAARTQDHRSLPLDGPPDEHVEYVVVGSGFGGSVAAYRFAEANRSVVVLERGKPYAPGDFARTPAEMSRNFWDPSEGMHGLFDVWTFRGLEGVVSSGLGGGSLIYANVLLRKDEKWFVHDSPVPGGGYEHWPVSRSDLDPHYDVVEKMLGANPYPYRDTPKTHAMRAAAQALGLDLQLPPLAVSFAADDHSPAVPGAPLPTPEYGNWHGVPRRTCRLTGECDIGCNDGAKNTLDHTYLSAAKHHGADIRTHSEVVGIAPADGGGYLVRYVEHVAGRSGATNDLPRRTIHCDRLVVAGGTFGSSYLMLRNRAAFPGLSRTLGTRFCGNGDLLGFLLNARDPSTATGVRQLDASRGPVITTAIRIADELDGAQHDGRGYYVEDAGYPMFADWLLEASQLPGVARRALHFAAIRLRRRLGESANSGLSAEMAALLGPGDASRSALPLLGMGRDVPDGVMRLRDGYLDIDWTTSSSTAYFDRVRSTMQAIAGELQADFADNPLWWTKRVITVHPLGGVPMGRHPGEGVCDSYGEVFGFPGLHVLDGSLLPGPVGANPSLTIAAVADRACTRMLSEPRTSSRRVSNGSAGVDHRPAAAGTPVAPGDGGDNLRASDHLQPQGKPTSVRFTEDMRGYVTLDDADPVSGAALGYQLRQGLHCHLTITAEDIQRFVAEAEHLGRVEGYVQCDAFGGRCPISRGWFNLFVTADDPAYRRMLYRLHIEDAGGNPLTLLGHKRVGDRPGLHVWGDTSTLYVQVLSGHVLPGGPDATRPVRAAGVLRIEIPDFARQLTTFRTHGPLGLKALASFGTLFGSQLLQVYGSRLPWGHRDAPGARVDAGTAEPATRVTSRRVDA